MSRLQLVHKGTRYVNKFIRISLSLLTWQQVMRLTSHHNRRQSVGKKQAKFQRRKGRRLRLNFSWFRGKKKKRREKRLV